MLPVDQKKDDNSPSNTEFEFAVYYSLYKKDKGGDLVLKGHQRRTDFPTENRIAPLIASF